MMKVRNAEQFRNSVEKMAKSKNAKLFHCYIAGEVFRIATARKVQDYDFTKIEELEAVKMIDEAIRILRENLNEQYLLFSDEFSRPLAHK